VAAVTEVAVRALARVTIWKLGAISAILGFFSTSSSSISTSSTLTNPFLLIALATSTAVAADTPDRDRGREATSVSAEAWETERLLEWDVIEGGGRDGVTEEDDGVTGSSGVSDSLSTLRFFCRALARFGAGFRIRVVKSLGCEVGVSNSATAS
jgi:hypothetical protein